MRVIKFKRAYFEDEERKCFIYYLEWAVQLNGEISFTCPFTNNSTYYFTDYQFTGLTDKNGVDIYEGNILKAHGIVAWNDVEHKWSVIDLNWNDDREWHNIDYLTSPFEVIGNIHENPELIK